MVKHFKPFFTLLILLIFTTLVLSKGEKLSKPWIGIQVGELTRDLSIKYGYYPNMNGVFIHYVFPAGPSGLAGIQSGDIITGVDGQKISTAKELAEFISKINSKKNIKISLFRNSKNKVISVSVIENPYPNANSSKYSNGKEQPWFGVTLKNIDRDMAEIWGFPIKNGVLVVNVYDGSASCKAGIQAGDIIVEVNGEPIKN
ncbi:MAG TPA: PDZ domain-containing protein, partial [Candidatus Eremiobacteraeota bacterium]|nr:PDZ domain-containing protein [Candidatus Eremiobacteraeota bacterium]